MFEATSNARRMWRIDFELPNYTPLSQEREQHLHLRVNTRYNRFRWKMIAASRRADALISIAECAVESSLFAHHLSKVSTRIIMPARSRQPGATSDLTQIRQNPFTLPAGTVTNSAQVLRICSRFQNAKKIREGGRRVVGCVSPNYSVIRGRDRTRDRERELICIVCR